MIDLDTRQQTLTRFFENRARGRPSAVLADRTAASLRDGARRFGRSARKRSARIRDFADAIGAVEHHYEFVVIDTPASDSLSDAARPFAGRHADLAAQRQYHRRRVFSRVNHDRKQRGAVAHYADLVLEARRRRRLVDNGVIDWVMVRNRVASLASNNARQIALSIAGMSRELRFRVADGFHDRVIFRELFPIGLTALDAIEQGAQKGALTSSQRSTRQEIEEPGRCAAAADTHAGRRAYRLPPAVACAGVGLLSRSSGRGSGRRLNRSGRERASPLAPDGWPDQVPIDRRRRAFSTPVAPRARPSAALADAARFLATPPPRAFPPTSGIR